MLVRRCDYGLKEGEGDDDQKPEYFDECCQARYR
jgi:hypothetical protein